MLFDQEEKTPLLNNNLLKIEIQMPEIEIIMLKFVPLIDIVREEMCMHFSKDQIYMLLTTNNKKIRKDLQEHK